MPRFLTGTRVLFTLITAFAVVGGYVGIAEMKPGLGLAETSYGTLQLFVLGNPLFDEVQPWPWYLNAARFAAPAVTGYALFETARLIATEQARLLRARTIHGHTIVTGDTLFAETITRVLEQHGTTVTRIIGPADGQALRKAGVSRADVLIACADHHPDPWVNLVTAIDASQIERSGRPLTIHAELGDATVAFTARSLGMTQASKVKVRLFNMEELAAAALAKSAGAEQDIAIVGLQEFGSALLVELARTWHRLAQAEPLKVTVVDDQAAATVARLIATYPVIGSACKVTVPDSLDGLEQTFSRVYVCYQDEVKALNTALSTAGLWPTAGGGLVVRLDRLAGISQAFGATGRLLDDMQGRLRITSVTELASMAMATEHDDSHERIARAIHERYLTQQLARQTGMGTTPAMVVWEELPESLRDANRAQAAGIREKLERIGCTIAVHEPGRPPFSYQGDELETLAVFEHERWMQDKLASGWSYGSPRNDAARRHDCLLPWEKLAETEREKDRDAVRNIPELLAEVGLQPVRLAKRS